MGRETYMSSICECLNFALNATVIVQKNYSVSGSPCSYIEVRYKHKTFALLPHFFDECLDENLTVAEAAYKGVDNLRDLVIKEFGTESICLNKSD